MKCEKNFKKTNKPDGVAAKAASSRSSAVRMANLYHKVNKFTSQNVLAAILHGLFVPPVAA